MAKNNSNEPRTLEIRKSKTGGVFASEAVARTWSIPFPWLDRADFYRSGLPTRTLAAHFAGTIRRSFVRTQKLVDAFGQSMRCSI
jgi:hypothetical protein